MVTSDFRPECIRP